MIPLIVVLWENVNYGGRKRLLFEDMPNLGLLGFNDTASAIGIHPGPDYAAWQAANGGQAPFALLYKDNDYQGSGMGLAGGVNTLVLLPPFDFNDSISSVRINPPILRDTVDNNFLGQIDLGGGPSIIPALDAPIVPIPLIAVLYTDVPFTGIFLNVLEDSSDIAADFGSEFSGSASSLQVIQGPNYNGEVVRLFSGTNFSGTELQLGPGSYVNLGAFNFNDQARSIKVR